MLVLLNKIIINKLNLINMKKIDLVLLMLFLVFAAVVSDMPAVSSYTPKVVVGGILTVVLVYIACRLSMSADKQEIVDLYTNERKNSLERMSKIIRLCAWGLFLFYILMVTIGF